MGYPGGGRHHPITFANETHAFLLTGTTSASIATREVFLYTEADDTWTQLPDVPGPARSFGYGVVLTDDGSSDAFCGLGLNDEGQYLSDWWKFDMQTLAWEQLASLPSFGRRHPAVVPVQLASGDWKIHVGLGDGAPGNLNDWWIYDVASDSWTEGPEFPSTPRHHPFYFGLGEFSYAGLGHSDAADVFQLLSGVPQIERDWYRFDDSTQEWERQADFTSYSVLSSRKEEVSSEARVAGTQFSIEGPLLSPPSDVSLGFVLSGDGDDHRTMQTGEFHAFHPATNDEPSFWQELPPHPGTSRWAPGSFVMRGTTRAYFTSGLDRTTGDYYSDLWMIDVGELFSGDGGVVPVETNSGATNNGGAPFEQNTGGSVVSVSATTRNGATGLGLLVALLVTLQ